MVATVDWPSFPTVQDFEYNEEESVSANFFRLVEETTESNPFSTEKPDEALTFKQTHWVIIHLDVDTSRAQQVMWLFYWFMEEFFHQFPGDQKLDVMQILE